MCEVCGSSISHFEAQAYVNTCSRLPCRVAQAQRRGSQLARDNRQLAREAARRRQEQASAHLRRLAGELQIATRPAPQALALPAQQRPLVPLSEGRKARFRAHLRRILQEAFADRDVAPAVEALPGEERADRPDEMLPVIRAACATCRGWCCLQGGEQAYLTADSCRAYRTRHQQVTVDEVYRQYEARLEERAYEDSCVYHQEQGCGLPREMRSETCNRFECQELAELRRAARGSGQVLFLVALDGSRAARWSVLSTPSAES